jgi:acyl-coenzyme A thioesterase PaaI-like protein
MSASETDVAALRAAYSRCFGCGLNNEHGLQLDGFTVDESGVIAPFSPKPDFAGFEGILHGGVVATALDEISAWSAMLTEGVFVYTAKLDIRFRKQADLDNEFLLRASVVERRGKRLTIGASLSGNSKTVAESTGLFVVAEDIQSVL